MVASKLIVIDPNHAKPSEDYNPIVSIKTFFNEYFVYNYDNSYKYQPMTTDMDQWPIETPNILQREPVLAREVGTFVCLNLDLMGRTGQTSSVIFPDPTADSKEYVKARERISIELIFGTLLSEISAPDR
jgi:hypothetical protein